MRSRHPDTPIVRRSPFEVLCAMCHAPLLPYRTGTFHQDTMGAIHGSRRLHTLPDSSCQAFWQHPPRQRGRRRIARGRCHKGKQVPRRTETDQVKWYKGLQGILLVEYQQTNEHEDHRNDSDEDCVKFRYGRTDVLCMMCQIVVDG